MAETNAPRSTSAPVMGTCDRPRASTIAGQFCGQSQPHAAHWWQTPPEYGTLTLIGRYQCAGYQLVAPAPVSEPSHQP